MTDQDKEYPTRHRAYAIILLLTLAAVILTYLIELTRGVTDPFNAVVLPLLAVLLGGLTVGHLRRFLNLRRTEVGFLSFQPWLFLANLGLRC